MEPYPNRNKGNIHVIKNEKMIFKQILKKKKTLHLKVMVNENLKQTALHRKGNGFSPIWSR